MCCGRCSTCCQGTQCRFEQKCSSIPTKPKLFRPANRCDAAIGLVRACILIGDCTCQSCIRDIPDSVLLTPLGRALQPPHRHNATALDLAIEAGPGVYTLMARGAQLTRFLNGACVEAPAMLVCPCNRPLRTMSMVLQRCCSRLSLQDCWTLALAKPCDCPHGPDVPILGLADPDAVPTTF